MSKKVIKITESKFKNLLKNEIYNALKNKQNLCEYALSDVDELMEFMWLKKSVSHLNVDIFIDDGFSYKRHNHVPLIFVRNSYDIVASDFIPISISDKPFVLDSEMDFNVSYDTIYDVMDFIQANQRILMAIANEEISHSEFISNIKTSNRANIIENRFLLREFATLKTNDSGLPIDIWLDEGGLYHPHAPRIKFKASNEQHTTREYSSMLISDPTQIENMPSNSPIRKKDLEKIQNFVTINKELLLKLANGEIDYSTEFLPNMKI